MLIILIYLILIHELVRMQTMVKPLLNELIEALKDWCCYDRLIVNKVLPIRIGKEGALNFILIIRVNLL